MSRFEFSSLLGKLAVHFSFQLFIYPTVLQPNIPSIAAFYVTLLVIYSDLKEHILTYKSWGVWA